MVGHSQIAVVFHVDDFKILRPALLANVVLDNGYVRVRLVGQYASQPCVTVLALAGCCHVRHRVLVFNRW